MANPFFISQIPNGATYCRRGQLLGETEKETEASLNALQIVDPRWELEGLTSYSPRNEIASFFEIKDFQESKRSAEALCSMSLFDMQTQPHRKRKSLKIYLDGLKMWIAFYRDKLSSQKIRVYVGDNLWDTLHKEGILAADDVDFVRMADSSTHTEIGTFWRFLALDDYDYPYVYIQDIDGEGKMVNGEWRAKEIEGRLYKRCLPSNMARKLMDQDGVEMDMAAWVIPFPPEHESREGAIPDNECPLFFWVNEDRLSDPLFMHRLSEYFQFMTPTLVRGSRQLPFDIKSALCRHFETSGIQILYNPLSHRWTNFRERHPNLNFCYIDDHWLLNLTKVCRIKYIFHTADMAVIQQERKRTNDQWFLKRMYDQLESEGSCFMIGEGDRLEDGSPFCFSDELYAEFMPKPPDLFIQNVPDSAEYTGRGEFVKAYPTGDGGYEAKRLLNEFQIVDPRWELEDLASYTPRRELAALFEIKDMQESKKNAEALLSVSIFRCDESRWQFYLEELSGMIESFRSELPEQKLRVYAGDDVWDTLYAEGFLDADDVDFVRMADSSHYSKVGALWRYLAFDDRRHPYVHIYAFTDNPMRPLNLKGQAGLEALKRRTEGVDIGTTLVFLPNAERYEDTSEYEIPFFRWEQIAIDDPVFIYRLSDYCRSSAITTTRGDVKLPFDMTSALCHYLSETKEVTLYHPERGIWTSIREITTRLERDPMDEFLLFYLTKIIRVKYLIPEKFTPIIQRIMNFYGENCFLRRLYKQLAVDGNSVAIGNHEDRGFPFDVFDSRSA